VVATFDTFGNTNLIFPLSGGNFSINSCDLKSGIDHGSIGGVHNVSTEGIGSSNTTVVLTLGFGEPLFGPAIGTGVVTSVLLGEEELLFDSEPRVLIFGFFHHLVDKEAEVVSGRGYLVVDVGLTEGKEGVAVLSERVFDHADGLKPDLGISSNGLETRRTVVGPPVEVFNRFDCFQVGSGLGTEGLSGTVDPDVLNKGDIFF